MFGFLKRTPAKIRSAIKRSGRIIRGRFDSAVTTDSNARHWSEADGLSPDSSMSMSVRRTLRNRARYEVANNTYAKGIGLTLANDTIGTGPRLQVRTENPEVNRRIEQAFQAWAHQINLGHKLRVMRLARYESGEAFAMLVSNPALEGGVELDLRLIEADRITTPFFDVLDRNAVDGIKFDEFGNPTSYQLLRDHPGNTSGDLIGFSFESDDIPAADMIHYFRADRPDQHRGIPDITPALHLFAQLRRYTLAVIAAAETAADFAGILMTTSPPDEGTQKIDPFDNIKLEARMLVTMPEGWGMQQMKSEQPATTYSEFKNQIINEIARCLNMPFNVAAGNSSGYNFASGRLDHQTYFKSLRVERSHIECCIVDRVFAKWIDEAALSINILKGLSPVDVIPHQWFWDGFEHVDPLKEANAQSVKLLNHTTTLADEYAQRGQDWETQLRQRAKEIKLARELGLPEQMEAITTVDPIQAIVDELEDRGINGY